jgi:hypothetical protein
MHTISTGNWQLRDVEIATKSPPDDMKKMARKERMNSQATYD